MSAGEYAVTVFLAGIVMLAFAWSATRLTLRLLPGIAGTLRWLATGIVWITLLLWAALIAGTLGVLSPWSMALFSLLAVGVAFALEKKAPHPGPDDRSNGSEGPVASRLPRAALPMLVAGLLPAGLAFGAFIAGTGDRLRAGMTGFDSTWYHGPIAAEIARTGDTLSPHFVAPQFLTWFYPHNSELLHSIGLLGFGNDFPSLAINLVLFIGCLAAGWAIGQWSGAGPLSMGGVAIVVGAAVFADQAGEARNDIAGTFFLLAGVALATYRPDREVGGRWLPGTVLLVALAGGLAAGTKLNFLPPGLVLAAGAIFLARGRGRIPLLPWALGGFLAGGAYWYLRNLVASGSPLPWATQIGPLSLPGPDQETGGREPGSVFGYLTDTDVISSDFLPGLASALGDGWPVLLLMSLLGIGLCLGTRMSTGLKIGSLTAIAVIFSWILGPTSASGPEGEPAGFVSGLRYLAPGLALGMALLGAAIGGRDRIVQAVAGATIVLLAPFAIFAGEAPSPGEAALAAGSAVLLVLVGLAAALTPARVRRKIAGPVTGFAVLIALGAGYVAQDRYERDRYSQPGFVSAGLADAFTWARDSGSGTRIGSTATRIYPLTNPSLDNEVFFVGLRKPEGGFVRPDGCPEFVEAVNADLPDYLVASLDREGVGRSFPPEVAWLDRDPAAQPLFRRSPAAVFELTGPLDPDRCRG